MEIQLGNILEAACAMAGYELVTGTVPLRWRIMAGTAVNEGLRRIHAEKFPSLRRVELRRYRPIEEDLDEAAARYDVGQECWSKAQGSSVAGSSVSGDSIAGCYWRRTATGWEPLKMEQVSAFIAFDQPWEAVEIDPGGVVVEDFAFVADPKYHPDAAPMKGCGWFADGVLLPAPAPEGVYVRFTPKAPRVSFVEWSADRDWARGAGCYVSEDRDCYIAAADIESGEEAPSANAKWRRIRVRDEFETYLTELAAASLQSEDQGRYQTKAAAENEFAELQARFAEGTGDSRMRAGRFRR